MKCVSVLGILAITATAMAAPGGKLEPDDLPPPQPEAVSNAATVETPPVPEFQLPATPPGIHSPRALRVRGKALIGTEIKVQGYVTWVFDCVTQLATANPGSSRAQIMMAIDNDPTLCAYRFYLGDTKTTSADASIWVVNLPRPPGKKEREQLVKDKKQMPTIPRVLVGDFVTVTGNWGTQSPSGEHNTNGLVVYRGVERATPAAPGAPAAAAPAEPEITVVTKAPLREKVSDTVRNASAGHINACIKSISARQFDAAIAECRSATKSWDGNHLAWYTLASAHMAKGEWPQAKEAVEHAVTQRPDQGMYQLYFGISLYEGAQRARDDARKAGTAAPAISLDEARDALRRATKLNPSLWRAHYYLGRVYRDLGDSKRAAEEFSATIKTHPSYRFGYIALIELYRKWDYVDQALAIATLGTQQVSAAESWELYFELGMAYDAKRATDPAIEAFSKAIAGKPDDLTSKFQRGQLYFRKGDFASAKRDLDEVVKSTDPAMAAVKPVATQILTQIAAKKK